MTNEQYKYVMSRYLRAAKTLRNENDDIKRAESFIYYFNIVKRIEELQNCDRLDQTIKKYKDNVFEIIKVIDPNLNIELNNKINPKKEIESNLISLLQFNILGYIERVKTVFYNN